MRGLIGSIAFIFLIGTMGSLECEYITYMQFTVRCVAAFAVMFACVASVKEKEEE